MKNKTNKSWKINWSNDGLGCKDYTNNVKPQEVKMTNELFRKKSNGLFVDLVNQDF